MWNFHEFLEASLAVCLEGEVQGRARGKDQESGKV